MCGEARPSLSAVVGRFGANVVETPVSRRPGAPLTGTAAAPHTGIAMPVCPSPSKSPTDALQAGRCPRRQVGQYDEHRVLERDHFRAQSGGTECRNAPLTIESITREQRSASSPTLSVFPRASSTQNRPRPAGPSPAAFVRFRVYSPLRRPADSARSAAHPFTTSQWPLPLRRPGCARSC